MKMVVFCFKGASADLLSRAEKVLDTLPMR